MAEDKVESIIGFEAHVQVLVLEQNSQHPHSFPWTAAAFTTTVCFPLTGGTALREFVHWAAIPYHSMFLGTFMHLK